MKNKINQTIIIGAGGSYPYNFPLGEKLFDNIQETYVECAKEYSLKTYHKIATELVKKTEIFVKRMKDITGISLDKYINLNTENKKDGIKALSIEILKAESNSIWPGAQLIKGDWYKYLFAKMLSGLNTHEDIINNFHSNISFITFNYDRSLENFLYHNLFRILNDEINPKINITEIIERIPIIHVYGKIGYLPWEINNDNAKIIKYGDFDKYTVFKTIENITDMIQLIYDERKNSDQITKAKKIIEESNRILFCGFGYDAQNLEILGFPNILQTQQVFGTALHSTTNEILHIKDQVGNIFTYPNINILDLDCLTLLREHLLV